MESLRKKRSHIKGLITRQGNRLRELEALPPDAGNIQSAKSLQKKLEDLDTDFKQLHYDILDQIKESDKASLESVQEAFMVHYDQMEEYTARIAKFISVQPVCNDEDLTTMSLKLRKLQHKIGSTDDTLSGMDTSSIDHGLLQAVGQDLDTYRKNLQDIEEELYSLKLADGHELFELHKEVDAQRFECSRQYHSMDKPSSPSGPDSHSSAGNTCKLRKLEIPTFSGRVMDWDHFWRRFQKAVHENKGLTDDDKWEYLSQALTDGNAKDTIAGFTRASGQYEEAIKCLTERYHRPREVVDEHARALIESNPLKEGDAKELRRLHTTWTQHIRALENLGHKIDSAFLTSVLQLKLDKQTSAQWKWESRSHVLDPPKVDDFLLFLKDRATTLDLQSSEKKKPHDKKTHQNQKPVSTLVAHPNPPYARCVLCTGERHPLYLCDAFKSMSQDEKRSTLRAHNMCFNCLRTGHSAPRCNSSHRCKKCQRLHHTLLHLEYGARDNSAQNADSSSTPSGANPTVNAVTAITFGQPIIYMTCKILVTGPQGASSTARALIDTGAGVSFITERLANTLQLPRTVRNVQVCGISGQAV